MYDPEYNPILVKLASKRKDIDLMDAHNHTWVGYLSVGETYSSHIIHNDGVGYELSYAYTTKGFIQCYANANESIDFHLVRAYTGDTAAYSHSPSQHYFYTRRTIRIYSGTTLIDTIPSGSTIRTDGNSTAGMTHPDRLYITGYLRAGATRWKYYSSNTWAETGIKAGYYTWPSIKNN